MLLAKYMFTENILFLSKVTQAKIMYFMFELPN